MPSRIAASSAQASVDAAPSPIKPIAIQNALRSSLCVMTQSPSETLVACHANAHRLRVARAVFVALIWLAGFYPACDNKITFGCQTEGNTTAVCRHTVSLWRTHWGAIDLKID